MKLIIRYFIALALISLIPAKAIQAGIITVKQDGTGDYTTIQAGMNGCVWTSGDTVLVWPGVYYENIEYNGKHITVASLYILNQDKWYIHNTIIDGNHEGPCVTMNGGQYSMTIDGFTIRNGRNSAGGGIFCNLATVSINNSVIEDNRAISSGGGGIYCTQSNAFLSGSTIRFNQAPGAGGIFCNFNSDITFDPVNKCNIYSNYGVPGTDYVKSYNSPAQTIIVDTFTVANPDNYFIASFDIHGNPLNDVNIQLDHAYLQPVDHDLYVNPLTGDDSNGGISLDEPLRTIAFAFMLIESDSLNPHAIHLANGVYSPSTNEEKLPLGTRSYISLIGESRESTVIDADSLTRFIRSIGFTKHYSIENLTFTRGKGGIYLDRTDHVSLKNLFINRSGKKSDNAIFSDRNDSLLIENTIIHDWKGRFAIECYNSDEENPKSFRIVNSSILNTIPSDDTIIGGFGGGIVILGGDQLPYSIQGEIINSQITNNLYKISPDYGPGRVSGLIASGYCKVNLINSTIGHNILRGIKGFGTGANSGAELNIYNSILYGDSLNELTLGPPSYPEIPSIGRVNYSDVEGGQNNVENWGDINTLVWGPGNMDSDPLWDTTAAFPYAIPVDSPCRNTGTPMYVTGILPPYIIQKDTLYSLVTTEYDTIPLPSTDNLGNPRIMEGHIDMGAFEYNPLNDISHPIIADYVKVTSIYPNPFYQNVFVSLEIKKAGHLTVDVFDIQGHRITNLMDSNTTPSRCSIIWDGKDELGWDVKVGEYMLKVTLDGKTLPGGKMVRGKWRR